MPPSDAPDSDTTSIGPRPGRTVPQFHSPQPLPFAPPGTFGPYDLLRRIGRGGLGDVYAARHRPAGTVVALKLLRDGEAATPAERRSFRREIEVARRISHPGLVPILDAGDIDGVLYFTMPLLAGGSLEHRLRAGAVPLRQGVAILVRVARAVHFAHDHGVLHRDLKPANILLNETDEPVVADFGLARLIDPATAHTITGVVMGSVPYMAPEQAAGHSHRATRATDVWPLGVILYELLAGRRPFQGASHSEVLRRIQHDVPTLPRHLRSDAPAALEAVCLRCLRKSPAARYATLAELADELERWLAGRPVHTALDVTRLARGQARWPRPGAAVALALVFALFGLGLLAASRAPAPAPEAAPAMPGDEQVRRAFAQARPGRPLVLFEQGGRPPWYALPVGGGDTMVTFKPGDPGHVNTPWACLLELLPPDPTRGPYRLTATIRHGDAIQPKHIGPYVGREHHPRPGEPGAHTFALLGYADPALLATLKLPAGPLAPGQGHRAALALGTLSPQGLRPPFTRSLRPGPNVPLAALPLDKNSESAWRELVIEARADSLRIALDGVTVRAAHAKLLPLIRASYRRDPKLKDVKPAYAPAGGAGLFVTGGSIAVRRVVVEPLPPAPPNRGPAP